jgi:ATP-dependent Clp protease ATP-binding subunit ClpC
MTSNVGARVIKDQGSLGFAKKSEEATYADLKRKLNEEMEKEFRPEFINRLDEVIVFHPLNREDIAQIVDLEIAAVAHRLYDKQVQMVLTAEAKEFLVEKGYSREFGARPMRRAVEHYIEDPLSEELLRERIKPSSKVELKVNESKEKLVFVTVGEFDPSIPPPLGGREEAASAGTSAPPSTRSGGPSAGGGAGRASG